MQFASYVFILAFLPITVVGYRLLQKANRREEAKWWLLVCSLYFIYNANPVFVIVIAAQAAINYLFYRILVRNRNKVLLTAGILISLSALAYCKYFNFFIETCNHVIKTSFTARTILVPLGISYYTFKSISFLVDSYRGEISDCCFRDYLLYLTFFPQVVSGPIAQATQFFPQLEKCSSAEDLSYKTAAGIELFILGLAKKVLIADFFGRAANWGFSADPSAMTSMTAFVVTLSYTLQIYYDFSGYSDMARGSGLLLGYETPVNFNSPYRAETIVDFWKRWHITLTQFLTKYVYIPLGGNRCGAIRTYINIFVVFAVSGLWHGANWTFIVWGAIHGIAQIVTKLFDKPIKKLPCVINRIGTFLFVNFAWTFFRADTIQNAIALLSRVVRFEGGMLQKEFWNSFGTSIPAYGIALIYGVILLMLNFLPNADECTREDKFTPNGLTAVLLSILATISIISLSGVQEFLYYNF